MASGTGKWWCRRNQLNLKLSPIVETTFWHVQFWALCIALFFVYFSVLCALLIRKQLNPIMVTRPLCPLGIALLIAPNTFNSFKHNTFNSFKHNSLNSTKKYSNVSQKCCNPPKQTEFHQNRLQKNTTIHSSAVTKLQCNGKSKGNE